MGIPFITQEEIQMIAYYPVTLDNIVCLENHLTAYDQESKKIYLPCNVTEDTKFYDIEGQLTSLLPEYKLYFLWEDGFNNMAESIRYSCNFTIFARDKEGHFDLFRVIFTPEPIIEMHGEVTSIDEREREIYEGEITVWDPNYQGSGQLKVQKSNLTWHVRGYSSLSFQKKSLKLNLKDKKGNNESLALLSFPSDDDYILNPMWFDDIKVREKLAMELWNEMADQKGSSLKMTGAEYCEIVINGEYQGLRLLQNKIDEDYLKLGTEDILLKGNNVNVGTKKPPEQVYETVYSKWDQETTYKTISDFFYQRDFSNVNLESWVDLQLFCQLGRMTDNDKYKNIYYVIERDGENETMSFIPWDTDMSFIICWNDGFRYMPESVESMNYRMEYDVMLETYPQLEEMLKERWSELRQSVITVENIFGKLDAYTEEITRGASLHRDFNYLGWNSWGGDDTMDNFKAYVVRRLEVMDELYGFEGAGANE